ncbi:MAG: nicotinate-nucleotide adenylyltransferase [Lachnospiraceae bacterium]|nr:nicotinate-nucleotide adenylyltransferase [Lachnospiraceae bacterium]MBQ8328446.1 nicotinate-nucleotide adenylyltransferase [Lachnospiraceae bacterium]
MREQTKKAEKIGILGGTFDPVHLGHLIIAEQARDQYELDKVLLIPSGHSYFKDNRSRKVLPAQVRLEMTKIAAGNYKPFEVSDIEVNRPGNSYSFETLEELKAQNPESELFFIVGADTICSMRTWREPERIFNVCTVLAAMREDQVDPEELKKETQALGRDFGARIFPVSIPNIGISSTQIRERAASGKSIHYLVPDALESYIIETGIYK